MYYKGEKMEKTSPNTDLHGLGPLIRAELGSRIPSDRKLRVLDVGTGFGLNLAFLSKHLGKGSKVWTVDPSDDVLDRARSELGAKAAATVEFVKASADRLDFEDGFFDLVVSVMVMHHIGDIRSVVKELVRVVKGGGSLLIVDFKPNAARTLEFHTRHEESDFFEPAAVKRELEMEGVSVKAKDYGLWYLAAATKPEGNPARKPAGRRPARP